jgi:predicted nucleic acid-binding Zn ribbon protein
MRSRAISAQCTLYLRHEISRGPDDEYKSLQRISYVDSSRPVQRPERGKATETVVCNECGRTVEFTVYSVKRTRQMRMWLFALLLVLVTLPVFSAVFLFDWIAGRGWEFVDALPSWVQVGLVTAGVLSLRIIHFSFFYWSDEYGVRSLHRWRYANQTVVSDVRRGNFVAKCAGTWAEIVNDLTTKKNRRPHEHPSGDEA